MKKPQDDKEAVKFHRLYTEQGVVNAQFRLAQMYYEGLGVEQDYKEAVKWFRLVAEQGDAEAQRSLGVMSLSAYPLMVFLVSKVSKRDLEEEQRIRDGKRKNEKQKVADHP